MSGPVRTCPKCGAPAVLTHPYSERDWTYTPGFVRAVAPTGAPSTAEVQAVLAQAVPRDRVILATVPEQPDRLDHIEREDVMVIPKGAWLQLVIWLAAAR